MVTLACWKVVSKTEDRYEGGHAILRPSFQLKLAVNVCPVTHSDDPKTAASENASKAERVEFSKALASPAFRFTNTCPLSVVRVWISKRLFSDFSNPGRSSNWGALTNFPVVS